MTPSPTRAVTLGLGVERESLSAGSVIVGLAFAVGALQATASAMHTIAIVLRMRRVFRADPPRASELVAGNC